jgi:DNA-binding NarL/FixJ family response regulator
MERAPIQFTEQERAIVELLAEGRTISSIALVVGLPPRGVTRQIEHCRQKLEARNNSELVAKVASLGLFD